MTSTTPEVVSPFTVLVVCTGNICRSPLAERLLSSRLNAAGIPATVHSAGTRAMVGYDMEPDAAALLSHYGVDYYGGENSVGKQSGVENSGGENVTHSARQLTPQLVAEADLVLTASREHRSEVVSLYPRASRYTYTLTQFARLTAPPVEESPPHEENPSVEERPTKEAASRNHPHEENPAALLRAYVADIAASRGFAPPPEHPQLDDIEDPYRQSSQVWQSSGRAIDEAVTTITAALVTASGRT